MASFLTSLFGSKKPRLEIDHAIFGHCTFSRSDGWRNPNFTLWGIENVELLIDAPASGPTERQEDAVLLLRDAKEVLLPKCLEALATLSLEMESPEGEFSITGLTVPALDGTPSSQLWTLWFDKNSDDHFWYGVQSDDSWKTIHAFADD